MEFHLLPHRNQQDASFIRNSDLLGVCAWVLGSRSPRSQDRKETITGMVTKRARLEPLSLIIGPSEELGTPGEDTG